MHVTPRNVDYGVDWMQSHPIPLSPNQNFPKATYGGLGPSPLGLGACGGDCGCVPCRKRSGAMNSIRRLAGFGALAGFGQAAEEAALAEGTGTSMTAAQWAEANQRWVMFYSVLGMVGGATGIYHGYKRNRNSLGWGLAWGLVGSIFPVITIPVMFAQGFGKRKRGR